MQTDPLAILGGLIALLLFAVMMAWVVAPFFRLVPSTRSFGRKVYLFFMTIVMRVITGGLFGTCVAMLLPVFSPFSEVVVRSGVISGVVFALAYPFLFILGRRSLAN